MLHPVKEARAASKEPARALPSLSSAKERNPRFALKRHQALRVSPRIAYKSASQREKNQCSLVAMPRKVFLFIFSLIFSRLQNAARSSRKASPKTSKSRTRRRNRRSPARRRRRRARTTTAIRRETRPMPRPPTTTKRRFVFCTENNVLGVDCHPRSQCHAVFLLFEVFSRFPQVRRDSP